MDTAIEELIMTWRDITDYVIDFSIPAAEKFKEAVTETYLISKKYREKESAPKTATLLFLEMKDFAFWAYDLEETPLHKYYREILVLTTIFETCFLGYDYNPEDVDSLIKTLTEYIQSNEKQT